MFGSFPRGDNTVCGSHNKSLSVCVEQRRSYLSSVHLCSIIEHINSLLETLNVFEGNHTRCLLIKSKITVDFGHSYAA